MRPRVAAWGHAGGRDLPAASDERVSWSAVDITDRDAVTRTLDQLRPSVIYHCAGIADVHGTWADLDAGVARERHRHAHAARRRRAAGARHPGPGHWFSTRVRLVARCADRGLAAGSVEPLRRQQARPGDGRRPGCRARHPHPSVQPCRPPAVGSLCDVQLRAPDCRSGSRDRGSPFSPSAISTPAATSPMCATPCAPIVCSSSAGGRTSPYNVCRGEAFRVGDLLDSLIRQAQVPIEVRTDPARLRPNDNPVVLGNPRRLQQDTGWAPAIGIDDTLRDLLAYWRRQLTHGPQ